MNKDEKLLNQLIQEANNNGFNVKEYNELKAIKRTIKGLIPIIIKYLYMFKKGNYKDAMVDLLSVKGFYDATKTLLELYYSKDINIDKWNIGNALYSIQDKRYVDECIEIVSNKENGSSRQMIVILLGKLRCEKAIPTLLELLIDSEVNGHAIMALGYFKKKKLIKHIEPFLQHEKKWIQKEATKAIKKIQT